jgi:hypothetical protein
MIFLGKDKKINVVYVPGVVVLLLEESTGNTKLSAGIEKVVVK